MKEERHNEILKEVIDEIDASLKDERGLVSHQRRLAFSLSLGAVNLIESYFHKNEVMKTGSQINHRWFKRKKDVLIDYLQKQIISPISSIYAIEEIINIAIKIEEKRDDLAYGVPSTENVLNDMINLFFRLQELTLWKI